MKIYVNNQNRICAINNTSDTSLVEYEIPDNTFSSEATEDLIKCYSCRICILDNGIMRREKKSKFPMYHNLLTCGPHL